MTRRNRPLADLVGADKPAPIKGRAPTPTRDRLNEAQAQLAEIRARKISGDLIPVADVQAEWATIIIDVRAGMLAVADRVGARLGDLTPHHLAVIDQEIRAALAALAAQADSDGPR